ncbi:Zn-dependent hydrolase [Cupriavidus pauculus]|uniref:Hydantoinase/carbamoylase family amidase n=1 Tax=Cupriavidus pauculus TaxID=82633 RepID=A0A3G8H9J8_9BURK|nr:Zn-dependent hydrolase [Cupriavidus pauculus]AZG17237.1 hydantoinase/carbamoylase family amidase [Cupriavidus pauculus]
MTLFVQPATDLDPDLELAASLFAQLASQSHDGVGITRDSYGDGENAAHAWFAAVAERHGLEVRRDAASNLYLTLPGRDRAAPAVMTGSHLDSVPRGGNFDGAAGVVAGLALLAGWRRAGVTPARDVTVMGIRAEESAWFPVSYAGSKAAFGMLDADALALRRADTGRTLADHMRAAGGDPDAVAQGVSALDAARIDCFVELHIEQGPVLEESGDVLGVVTGICGSQRYRHATIRGQYAHSGATPRSHRQDAVVAAAALVTALQRAWVALEAAGHELTVTVGQCSTDAAQADFSKVSGRVDFSIDMRSRNRDTLDAMDAAVQSICADIIQSSRVSIDLGPVTSSASAAMDPALQAMLTAAAGEAGVPARAMPSGAGHDAALFASRGIPAAMLFVRNAHGSHNPDESMRLDDFAQATRVLAQVLGTRAGVFPLNTILNTCQSV